MEQNLDKNYFLQELNLLVLSLVVSTFVALDSIHSPKDTAVSITKTEEKPLVLKHDREMTLPATKIRSRI